MTQLDIQVEGSPGFCAEEKDLELSWDVKNSEQKVTQSKQELGMEGSIQEGSHLLPLGKRKRGVSLPREQYWA